MEKKLYELKSDPELEMFMSPLSESEETELEQNIIANGCRIPIVVWNGTIVDGHHRYKICHKHGIHFAIEEQTFSDIDEAKLWMFQEQRSHRNLSEVARVVMALKCKPILLEKGKKNQGHRSDLDSLFTCTKSHNTRKMLAEMAGASETMVHKIERIWEAADDATKSALLNGSMKVNTAYRKCCKKKTETSSGISVGSADEAMLFLRDVVADFEEGLEAFTHLYNYTNSSREMDRKILDFMSDKDNESADIICRHIMNLPMMRDLYEADEDADGELIVSVHNEFLREVGMEKYIMPELKDF